MGQVSLNTPAPDFTLEDLTGTPFTLSQLQGKKHVFLIFNRGFF